MIKKIASAVSDLDGFAFVASIAVGVAALGYVIVRWTIRFVETDHYVWAVAICSFALSIATLAIVRSPFAQLFIVGSAIVVGVGFATGTQHFFLP